MTLTQHALVWGLRAIVIWAVAEFSLGAFDEALRERQLMDGWRNQAAVEARMARRAQDIEQAAAALERTLGASRSGAATLDIAPGLDPGQVIAAQIRRDLTTFGAREANVTVRVAPLGDDYRRGYLTLRWREPVAASPAALTNLAGKHPYLRLASLKITRNAANTETEGEAELQVDFRINLTPEAR